MTFPNRTDYLDVAKGIGIIFVYIGHCYIGDKPETFRNLVYWIYSFHMPLFFFISGFLFSRKHVSTKSFLWRKTISLIVPYLFFSVVNWPLLWLFVKNPGNVLLHGWGTNPLWFLPILFIIEILHHIIITGNIRKRIMSISLLVGILIWKVYTNQWLPYSISELPWFYLCFVSGYLLMPRLRTAFQQKGSVAGAIILVAVHIWFLFVVVKTYNVNFFHQDNDFLSYIYRYLCAMVGTLALITISHQIQRYAMPVLWIGKNTLPILCTHMMYYEILQTHNYHAEYMGGQIICSL